MSVIGKQWEIINTEPTASTYEKIIQNRAIKPEDELHEYHDPFLFEDMEKSVSRILQAIKDKERIIIFGDYDVDGISSAAILVHILQKLKATVSYRLPNRVKDGYGLSEKFITEFIENNIGLIITVDCGISCADLITKAKEGGVDTIITDHHNIPANHPEDAHSIIHPKLKGTAYPFPELTGSGVAFKLAHALILKALPEENIEDYVDLASLGTVADLGPLTDENRLIVKRGLKALQSSKWHGLKHLLEKAHGDPSTVKASTIGFRIGPRINAAGRIGDPYIPLQLLLQAPQSPKISEFSEKLESLNKQRQDMTAQAIQEAQAHFADQATPLILVASHPDWHVGILGLIASRLVEKYSRPAIIMQDLGDTLVASARSPEFFSIIEAITAAGEHLITFGGHAGAAGLSLKKSQLPAFKEKILAFAAEKLKDHPLRPTIKIDCELPHHEISLDLIDQLSHLEPFGIGNLEPVFIIKNLEPVFAKAVGKTQDHLTFSFNTPQAEFKVIGFNLAEHIDLIRQHRKIDLVCQLEKDSWKGRISLKVRAIDFSPTQE